VNQYSDGLSEVLLELSSFILSEENLSTTLQRVVELSTRIVTDSEAGVLLMENGRPSSTAVSSDLVNELDDMQRQLGDGPCLTAIRGGDVVKAPDMTDEQRWPEFAKAALDRGVQSMTCFPLVVRDSSLGALNFFSASKDAFQNERFEIGGMFAAQAAVSIHNSQLYLNSVKLAEQLKEALESRAVIDQAKGILMEREGLDPDAAFGMLRSASQNLNLKLRDIAHQIVDQRSASDGHKSDGHKADGHKPAADRVTESER
jgi:GAF domain-containing protein